MLSDLRASPDGHHHLPRQVRGLRLGWGDGAAARPESRWMVSHSFLLLWVHLKRRKNRPRNGGICVANHTSPIDVIILASDGYYAMVRPVSVVCSGRDSSFRLVWGGGSFLGVRTGRGCLGTRVFCTEWLRVGGSVGAMGKGLEGLGLGIGEPIWGQVCSASLSHVKVFSVVFVCFWFLGPDPRHMEVPRPGV